ncbi:MAG: hypothetical protein EOP93_15245, partial [Lysobacteraceae bacterium]
MKERTNRQAWRITLAAALLPLAVGSAAQSAMHWGGTVDRTPQAVPAQASPPQCMALCAAEPTASGSSAAASVMRQAC